MWMPFERGWREVWLDAMLPASGTVPGYVDADTQAFWERYPQVAPTLLRLGFRAALWMLFARSLVRHRATPGAISVSERESLLADSAESDLFLMRQLMVVVKLVATLAAFTDPEIRKAADP